jgi:class 3 adenylate cyclase
VVPVAFTPDVEFWDEFECAAMFIDISGFSRITDILFNKHGLEGVETLASTLNLYLGRIVETLTQSGGDVIKFAGDAALVVFPVTADKDLTQQALKATQLSLQCIAELEHEDSNVEGVQLTAHTGIGVGTVTGFLVGGVFNRSEYAVVGEPVTQIASAEPAAGNGETVVSAETWALIEPFSEGRLTTDDNWLVTGTKEGQGLSEAFLHTAGGSGVSAELQLLDKEHANLVAASIKQFVSDPWWTSPHHPTNGRSYRARARWIVRLLRYRVVSAIDSSSSLQRRSLASQSSGT